MPDTSPDTPTAINLADCAEKLGWHDGAGAPENAAQARGVAKSQFQHRQLFRHRDGRRGVIQIFNMGLGRMLGYAALDVMNKIRPADISDPQELVARAKALSLGLELATPITPGFEAQTFKASRGIEDIHVLIYVRGGCQASCRLDG